MEILLTAHLSHMFWDFGYMPASPPKLDTVPPPSSWCEVEGAWKNCSHAIDS